MSTCTMAAQAAVRDEGAIPATIAILSGQITVGLSDSQLEALAHNKTALKVSRRDLAHVVARAATGATTVAATMWCADRAGIGIFATGGIGGVHRGADLTFDVSADLTELGRTPTTVICAGAKSILDLPKTVEVLETQGVPIFGSGTDEFPGFFTARTGLSVDARFDEVEQLADAIAQHKAMGLAGAVLVVQPPPAHLAISEVELETWMNSALKHAADAGIYGYRLTPFLLDQLRHLSGGKTLALNTALIESNARLAARLSIVSA